MAAEFRPARLAGALALCAALASFAATAAAPTPVQGPWSITFADIARAERESWLDLDQTRRVLEQGRTSLDPLRWIEADERLRIGADEPDGSPRFALELRALRDANGPLPPDQVDLRRRLFDSHSGFLHQHASLRVHDAVAAAANYFLFYLDDGARAGRPTHRFAVLPRNFGVNPWIVELDVATRYPLYRGEFDAAGRLVSELIVERFAEIPPASRAAIDWWRPSLTMLKFPDLAAALSYLPPAAFSLPQPGELPIGFSLRSVRVVLDDLSPVESLVLGYTDGIDEMFVVASINASPPVLPAAVPGGPDVYALYEYRDQNIGQWMFHHRGVRHLVVGRSGQAWIPVLAHLLLTRSVSGS